MLATMSAPASAQSISVQGNKRVETETIRSFVTLAPGDSYTPARIDQAIKDLFATGLFSDVRVSRVRVRALLFRLSKTPSSTA